MVRVAMNDEMRRWMAESLRRRWKTSSERLAGEDGGAKNLIGGFGIPVAFDIFAGMSSRIACQCFVPNLLGSDTSQYMRIWAKRILASFDVAEAVDS
ncbi:hypothetical protein Tco_0597766 [Tanacetum coccineum]